MNTGRAILIIAVLVAGAVGAWLLLRDEGEPARMTRAPLAERPLAAAERAPDPPPASRPEPIAVNPFQLTDANREPADGAAPADLVSDDTEPIADDDPRPHVVARIVGPQGKPAGRATFEVNIQEQWTGTVANHVHRVTTDATGRFAVLVPLGKDPPRSRAIQVFTRSNRTGAPAAEAPIPELRETGPTDVGDLVLGSVPLLVSGRVVDDQGKPVADIAVHVDADFILGPSKAERERPGRRAAFSAITEADGTFELRGRIGGTTGDLVAAPTDRYLEGRAPFQVGATNVELRVARAAGLQGSVRLPPGMPPATIRVFVRVTAGDRQSPRPHTGKMVHVEANGSFAFGGLEPGTAEFSAVLLDPDAPVTTIKDVALPAGEIARDPRLQDLDLSPFTKFIKIDVVDDEHHPLADADVNVTDPELRRSRTYKSAALREGITVRANGCDIVVHARGHRSVEARGVVADTQIVLPPGLHARLALPRGVEGPRPPSSIRLSFVRQNPPAGAAAGGSTLTATVESVYVEADGACAVSFPLPGRYTVVAEVGQDSKSRAIQLRGPIDILDEGGEQRIELPFNAAALKQALDQTNR